MRLVNTPEQRDFTRSLRDLFTGACPPSLVREMKAPGSDGFPAPLWKALAGTGAFGLAVDAEYGGDGAGLYELGLLFAEAGRALCPTVVYSTLAFGVAAQRLARPGQAKRLLPALARGELRAATALWNPADAGDTRPAFTAERADGGWTLRGERLFVADARLADVVLVTATARGFAEPGRVLAFFARPGGPGWHAEPLRTMSATSRRGWCSTVTSSPTLTR